ncbi:HdeD family acid-resistance protein [Oecophyllibacter saccharovorans]|uniref:HdeD family acid-resistance protein n=1 Tax=Oecophyllibacter saccharovorans TaxID=2558360 RepID=UPI001E477B3F|nr:DUF308 domain-containing protein [Oecophyllibacter saccharovorans]
MNEQEIIPGVGVLPTPAMKPGYFIAAGIIMVLLGILAWICAFQVSLASTIVLGVLLIAGGVMQLVQVFGHGPTAGMPRWLAALTGVLIIISGALLCLEPVQGAMLLTAFIAAMLIIGGLMRIYWAFQLRHIPGWWVGLLSGGVTLLVGVLLYATLPWAGLLFIGTLIAVELIMAGVSATYFGFTLRKVEQELTQVP